MDKRIIKTRRKVKDAVLDLYMRGEPLENYPIKYLCKEVGLNRTTFYIHYSCIDDVIEDLADEIGDKLYDLLYKHIDDPAYCAEALITFIKTHEAAVKLVLNESKLKWINSTIDRFKELLNDAPFIKNIYDKAKKEYTINFVVYGTYGVLLKWVKDEFREERASVVKKLIKFMRIGE